MTKLGFGIFGRPVGHRFVTNGLIKQFHLGDKTYLDPDLVILEKEEQLIEISRHIKDEVEIISIFIYEYAKSFNSRSGGFIGSAYAFTGNPSRKFLHDVIKNQHQKIFKLLNEDGKFKNDNFEIKEEDLHIPNPTGLVDDKVLRPSTNNYNTENLAILTDGDPIEMLALAVQGFMYNPNFRKYETLYISDKKDLLKRVLKGNEKHLIGFGHLFNFNKLFKNSNQRLAKEKAEYNEIRKRIQEEKKNKASEIEKHIEHLTVQKSELDSKIKEKIQNCAKLDKDILERKDELNNLDRDKNAAEENKNKINNEIQSLRETKKKLENENQTAFNKLINNKDFERERNNFIENSSLVKELKNEKSNLEEKIGKSEKVTFKEKVLIIGIPLILLIGSYLIGNYFPIFNKKPQPEITINETEDQSITKKSAEFKQLPEIYKTKEFINLSEEKQKSHKDSIDKYLDALKKEELSKEHNDLNSFFNRKWNFAELIDVDKFNPDDVLGGLDRITKIKEIYKKHGKDDSVFSKRFGITEIDKAFEEKDFQFESDKRNEILNKYISEDRNIYKELGFSEYRFETGFDNLGNLDGKGDDILIYMHFRWMVYKLSGDKTDLKTTTKREHKVLFTK